MSNFVTYLCLLLLLLHFTPPITSLSLKLCPQACRRFKSRRLAQAFCASNSNCRATRCNSSRSNRYSCTPAPVCPVTPTRGSIGKDKVPFALGVKCNCPNRPVLDSITVKLSSTDRVPGVVLALVNINVINFDKCISRDNVLGAACATVLGNGKKPNINQLRQFIDVFQNSAEVCCENSGGVFLPSTEGPITCLVRANDRFQAPVPAPGTPETNCQPVVQRVVGGVRTVCRCLIDGEDSSDFQFGALAAGMNPRCVISCVKKRVKMLRLNCEVRETNNSVPVKKAFGTCCGQCGGKVFVNPFGLALDTCSKVL